MKKHPSFPRVPWRLSSCHKTREADVGCGGGVIPITSYLPSTKVGSTPSSTSVLSGLNTYLPVWKFCMDSLNSIIQRFHQGCWMVSLDLKDVYLQVPIHPSNWRYLPFALKNAAGDLIVYQWKVIPFGLATIPRVFAKLQAPVTDDLH